MKKLSEQDMAILGILKDTPQGAFLWQIQKFAKIAKKQYAHYYVNKLIRKGYVRKDSHLYFLIRIPNHPDAAERPLSEGNTKPRLPDQSYYPTSPIATRTHAWGLAYPLKDKLDPNEPPRLFSLAGFSAREIRLRNNMQGEISVGSVTARLTADNLFLYTKDAYTDNRTESIDLEASLKQEFDRIALDLESKLRKFASFKLVRIDRDTLYSHVVRQHYAEEHHPTAEASPKSPLLLARSPLDGQRRLGLDMSKGFRELELYHRLSADTDKDTLDRQFNALLDGRLSLFDIDRLKEVVGRVEQVQERIVERQEYQNERYGRFARDIDLHLKVMRKIDRKLSQRTLEGRG